jgi:hypothetical protein
MSHSNFRVWVRLWAGMLRNNTSHACQTGQLALQRTAGLHLRPFTCPLWGISL